MPEEPAQERTEEATPRRREEARRRGQIVKSRELSSVAILSTGFLSFLILSVIFFQQFYFILKFSFSSFERELLPGELTYLVKTTFFALMKFLFPFFLIITLSAVIVYLLQTGGGVFSIEVLSPRWERVDPIEGFKRLFSFTSLIELVKALIKIALICGISYWIISQNFDKLLKLLGSNSYYLILTIKALLKDLLGKLLFVLFILAILDWLYARWDVERKLRMTREELKEELKQTEGDPLVKARIRQWQRKLSRQRMLAEVPKADVVITNPEHYAVALKYEMGKMPAPQVVAKGIDFLALKIKEIARENGVPIYEDPPLAQILYKKVEVGEYVPEELYQVVAKVLAYVYKAKKKRWS